MRSLGEIASFVLAYPPPSSSAGQTRKRKRDNLSNYPCRPDPSSTWIRSATSANSRVLESKEKSSWRHLGLRERSFHTCHFPCGLSVFDSFLQDLIASVTRDEPFLDAS